MYIDFQIKLCLTTIDVSKYLVKNRDNLYAFAIYANQTIAGDKTNASVASLISKILGPLDKVQNQTIKAALVVLNQTVLNCTAVLNPFFSLVYNSAVLLDQSASFILTMNDQLQDSFKNLLTALTTSVTDTTLNSSKVADCEKVAFAAIDANIKNAYNSSDSCFQYYSEYVTHSFTSQVKRIFMESLQCASKALNNVTYCMKSNIISDAKGMDTTTNCTRDSFMTCLRWVSMLNLQRLIRLYHS